MAKRKVLGKDPVKEYHKWIRDTRKGAQKAIKEQKAERHIREKGTKGIITTTGTQDKVMVRWRISKDLFKKIKIMCVSKEKGINEFVEELLNEGIKGTKGTLPH